MNRTALLIGENTSDSTNCEIIGTTTQRVPRKKDAVSALCSAGQHLSDHLAPVTPPIVIYPMKLHTIPVPKSTNQFHLKFNIADRPNTAPLLLRIAITQNLPLSDLSQNRELPSAVLQVDGHKQSKEWLQYLHTIAEAISDKEAEEEERLLAHLPSAQHRIASRLRRKTLRYATTEQIK